MLILKLNLSCSLLCAAVDISLDQTQYIVEEANGFVEVCAELVGGIIERMVVVDLISDNIDATGKLCFIRLDIVDWG